MSAREVAGTWEWPPEYRRVVESLDPAAFVPLPPVRFTEASEAKLQRFIVQDRFGLDDVPSMHQWLTDVTLKAREDFDRQLVERVKLLPDGWRLCVHGVEMLSERGDSMNITWCETHHALAPDSICMHVGRKVEYMNREVKP
jgi:hypothetical protein